MPLRRQRKVWRKGSEKAGFTICVNEVKGKCLGNQIIVFRTEEVLLLRTTTAHVFLMIWEM